MTMVRSCFTVLRRYGLALLGACLGASAGAADTLDWLPADFPPLAQDGPTIYQGNGLTPAQGKAALNSLLAKFPDHASWSAYAAHVRNRLQEGANLSPWPRRTPLNPVIRQRRDYDGYSVENVAFESVPGYFVTGNLYRPLAMHGLHPAILATHGHTWAVITKPEMYAAHGRFKAEMQARCGALARMGAVVLSIDMFAFGDSIPVFGQEVHRQPFAMTIQIWNAIRALDFLETLEGVDSDRLAVTGESGGATQAIFLTALDERIALSVPAVMVSAHWFGGPCEGGLPVHRTADHFASNPVIAALAAPRPMLLISDGKDWTSHTPDVEFPFTREIYRRYGRETEVANVHLADEGHDYGPSKREAMYRFVAPRLGLDLAAILDAAGKIDESRITIEPHEKMHFFDATHPVPPGTPRTAAAVEAVLRNLQK
jgi:dienelactone hydrolase